jgi:hypothetical protein
MQQSRGDVFRAYPGEDLSTGHQRFSAAEWESNAYKYDVKPEASASGLAVPRIRLSDLIAPSSTTLSSIYTTSTATSTAGLMGFNTEKVLVKKGITEINIAWSATLDTKMRLKAPRIDSIDLGGTTWE